MLHKIPLSYELSVLFAQSPVEKKSKIISCISQVSKVFVYIKLCQAAPLESRKTSKRSDSGCIVGPLISARACSWLSVPRHTARLNELILVHCNTPSFKWGEEPLSSHAVIYIINPPQPQMELGPRPFTREYTTQVAHKTTFYVFSRESEWFATTGLAREWTTF